MKIRILWPALALAAFAVPCAAQERAEACIDTIRGDAVMTPAQFLAFERQSSPDPVQRAGYRLTMLNDRLGAWQREQNRVATQLFDFADRVPEVPWLSTCDPWGHRVRFIPRGDEYELRSAGPDGSFGTADDITRGGFFPRALLRPGPRQPTAPKP